MTGKVGVAAIACAFAAAAQAQGGAAAWVRAPGAEDSEPPALNASGLPEGAPLPLSSRVELRPRFGDDVGPVRVDASLDDGAWFGVPAAEGEAALVVDITRARRTVRWRLTDAAGRVTLAGPFELFGNLPPVLAGLPAELRLAPGETRRLALGGLASDDFTAPEALVWSWRGARRVAVRREAGALVVVAPRDAVAETLWLRVLDAHGVASAEVPLELRVGGPPCAEAPEDAIHVGPGRALASIAAALAAGHDALVVHAGTYGPFSVTRRATIVAACADGGPEAVVVDAAGRATGAIVVSASGTALHGLDVRGGVTADVLVSRAVDVELHGLRLSASASFGLWVRDGARVRVVGGTSESNAGDGVRVDAAFARLEAARVAANGGAGVRVSDVAGGVARVELQATRVHDNRQGGVLARGRGGVSLERVELWGQPTANLVVTGAGEGTAASLVRESRFSDGNVVFVEAPRARVFASRFERAALRFERGSEAADVAQLSMTGAAGAALRFDASSVPARVSECLFLGNHQALAAAAPPDALGPNAFWANARPSSGVIAMPGDVTTDPRVGADDRLEPGSPLIDAGGRSAAEAEVDGLFATRDGAPDRGVADIGYHHAGPPEEDAAPPEVEVTRPPEGLLTRPGMLEVRVATVAPEVRVLGVGAVTAGGAYPLRLAASGPARVVAVATDARGNAAVSTRTVECDGTPPLLVVRAPDVTHLDAVEVAGEAYDLHLAELAPDLPAPLPVAPAGGSLHLAARDAAGNVTARAVEVRHDTAPPRLTPVRPAPAFDASRPVFELDVDDAVAVRLTLDGDDVSPWTALDASGASGRVTFVPPLPLADGAHRLVLEAVDAAGNTATLELDRRRDSAPPRISLAGVEAGGLYAAATRFDVLVTDDSPVEWSAWLDLDALEGPGATAGEGTHLLRVVATDALGHAAELELQFAVDATPPELVAADPLIARHAAELAALVSVRDASATTLTLGPLDDAEGVHTVLATAVDAAGHRAQRVLRYVLDRTPPLVVVRAPGAGARLSGATVEVTGDVSDETPVDVSVASLDERLDAHVAADGSFVARVPLAPGALELRVTATDAAGNTRVERRAVWASRDDARIELRSADRTTRAAYRLDGRVTGADAATLDGAPLVLDAAGDFAVDRLLAPGDNVFVVAAGEARVVWTVLFDDGSTRGAAALGFIAPAPGALVSDARVLVRGRHAGLGFAPSVTVGGDAAAVTSSGFEREVTVPAEDGPWQVVASAGGVTATLPLWVDREAPTLTVDTPDGPAWTSPLLVTGVASDPLLAGVRVDGRNAPLVAGRFALVVPLAPGERSIVVTAYDVAGHSTSRTVVVTLAGEPPRVELLSPADGARIPASEVEVRVRVTPAPDEVTVNGRVATGDGETFAVTVPLQRRTLLEALARSAEGLVGRDARTVESVDPATLPLEVLASDPPAGASDVEPVRLVTVELSRPPLDAPRLRLTAPDGAEVPGSASALPGGRAWAFVPALPLALDATYAVAVDTEGLAWRAHFHTRPRRTTLSGTLVDATALPLSGLRVRLGAAEAVTDASGYFAFDATEAGALRVEVAATDASTGCRVAVTTRAAAHTSLRPFVLGRFAPLDRADPVGGRMELPDLGLTVELGPGGLVFPDGGAGGLVRAARLEPLTENPYPVAASAQLGELVTFGPLGLRPLEPLAEVRFANRWALAEGERVLLLTLDEGALELRPVATGTVRGVELVSDGPVPASTLDALAWVRVPPELYDALEAARTGAAAPPGTDGTEQGGLLRLLVGVAHAQAALPGAAASYLQLVHRAATPRVTDFTGYVTTCTARRGAHDADAELGRVRAPVEHIDETWAPGGGSSTGTYVPPSNRYCEEQLTRDVETTRPPGTPAAPPDADASDEEWVKRQPLAFPFAEVYGPSLGGFGVAFGTHDAGSASIALEDTRLPFAADGLGRFRFQLPLAPAFPGQPDLAGYGLTRLLARVRHLGACGGLDAARCRAKLDLNVASATGDDGVVGVRSIVAGGAAGEGTGDRILAWGSDPFVFHPGSAHRQDIRIPLNRLSGRVRLRDARGVALTALTGGPVFPDGTVAGDFHDPCDPVWDARARLRSPGELPRRGAVDPLTGDARADAGLAPEDLCRTDVYVFRDGFEQPVTAVTRAVRAPRAFGTTDATLYFSVPLLAATTHIAHRAPVVVDAPEKCTFERPGTEPLARLELDGQVRYLCDARAEQPLATAEHPFALAPGDTLHVVAVNRATGHTAYLPVRLPLAPVDSAHAFSFAADIDLDAFPAELETTVERWTPERDLASGDERALEALVRDPREAGDVEADVDAAAGGGLASERVRRRPLVVRHGQVAPAADAQALAVRVRWRARVAPEGGLAFLERHEADSASRAVEAALCAVTRTPDGDLETCSAPTSFTLRADTWVWDRWDDAELLPDGERVAWLLRIDGEERRRVWAADLDAGSLADFPRWPDPAGGPDAPMLGPALQPFTARHVALDGDPSAPHASALTLFALTPGERTHLLSVSPAHSHFYLHVVDGLGFQGTPPIDGTDSGARPFRAIPLTVGWLDATTPDADGVFTLRYERRAELRYAVVGAAIERVEARDARGEGAAGIELLVPGNEGALRGDLEELLLAALLDGPPDAAVGQGDAARTYYVRVGNGELVPFTVTGAGGAVVVEVDADALEGLPLEESAFVTVLASADPASVVWRLRAPLHVDERVLDPAGGSVLPGELLVPLERPSRVTCTVGEGADARSETTVESVADGGGWARVRLPRALREGVGTRVRVEVAPEGEAPYGVVDERGARARRLAGATPPERRVSVAGVSLASGDLALELPLFSMPTVDGALGLRLAYSNLDARGDSDLGPGWRHDGEVALWLSREHAVVVTADGVAHAFTWVAGGATPGWRAAAGERGRLVERAGAGPAVEPTPYLYDGEPTEDLVAVGLTTARLRADAPPFATLSEPQWLLRAESESPGRLELTGPTLRSPLSLAAASSACAGAANTALRAMPGNRLWRADSWGRFRVEAGTLRRVEGRPFLVALDAGVVVAPRTFDYTTFDGRTITLDVPDPRTPDRILASRDDGRRLQYDERGRLLRIYSSDGAAAVALCREDGARGRVVEARLHAGAAFAADDAEVGGEIVRSARFTYGGAARSLEGCERAGTRETFVYAETGPEREARTNLVEHVDADGFRWAYAWGGTLDGDRGAWESLPPDGERVARVSVDGAVIAVFSGRVEGATLEGSALDGLAHATVVTFDARGRPVVAARADGRSERLAWRDDDQLEQAIDVDGFVTTYTYAGAPARLASEDREGVVTRYEWDCAQGPCFVNAVVPQAAGELAPRFEDTVDARSGRLLRRVEASGGLVLESAAYDAAGRLTASTDARGVETRWSEHDAAGLPGHMSVGSVRLAYDALGRLSERAAELGAERYEYSPRGDLTQVTDARGTTTRVTARTPLGDPIAVVEEDADGAAQRWTTYEHDAAFRCTAVTVTVADDALEERWSLDAAGRVTEVTRDGLRVESTVYDDDERRVHVTGTYGEHVVEYGPHGAVRHTPPVGAPVSWSRDAAGRVTSAVDERGQTWGWAYDALDRVTLETSPLGERLAYAYRGASSEVERTVSTAAGGAVSCARSDALGRPLRLAEWALGAAGAPTPELGDAEDPCAAEDLPATTFVWAGLEASVQVARGDRALEGAVTLDAAGDVVAEWVGAGPERSVRALSRDALGRVTAVDVDGVATSVTLDAAGRTTRALDGAGRGLTTRYDGADRVLQVVSGAGADALEIVRCEYGGADSVTCTRGAEGTAEALVETVTLDGLGRPTSSDAGPIRQWKYDGAFVSSVADAGGITTRLERDADGRPVRLSALGRDGTSTRDLAYWVHGAAGEGTGEPAVTCAAARARAGLEGDGDCAPADPEVPPPAIVTLDGLGAVAAVGRGGLLAKVERWPGGLVREVRGAGLGARSLEHDVAGRVTSVAAGPERMWTVARDARGFATRVDAPGAARGVGLGYDAGGALTRIERPLEPEVALTVDVHGRVAGAAAGGDALVFEHDGRSRLVAAKGVAGDWTYGWSALDALESRAFAGETLETLDWSALAEGRVDRSVAGATLPVALDALGGLARDASTRGVEVSRDGAGRPARVAVGDVAHAFVYGDDGALAGVDVTGGGRTGQYAFAYTADGALAARVLTEGDAVVFEQRWAYDAQGRATTLDTGASEGGAWRTRSYALEYDEGGRVARQVRFDEGGEAALAFEYGDGRLVKVTRAEGEATWVRAYTYAPDGARASRVDTYPDGTRVATTYEHAGGRVVGYTERRERAGAEGDAGGVGSGADGGGAVDGGVAADGGGAPEGDVAADGELRASGALRYDAAGRLTSRTDTWLGAASAGGERVEVERAFEYDARDRLLAVEVSWVRTSGCTEAASTTAAALAASARGAEGGGAAGVAAAGVAAAGVAAAVTGASGGTAVAPAAGASGGTAVAPAAGASGGTADASGGTVAGTGGGGQRGGAAGAGRRGALAGASTGPVAGASGARDAGASMGPIAGASGAPDAGASSAATPGGASDDSRVGSAAGGFRAKAGGDAAPEKVGAPRIGAGAVVHAAAAGGGADRGGTGAGGKRTAACTVVASGSATQIRGYSDLGWLRNLGGYDVVYIGDRVVQFDGDLGGCPGGCGGVDAVALDPEAEGAVAFVAGGLRAVTVDPQGSAHPDGAPPVDPFGGEWPLSADAAPAWVGEVADGVVRAPRLGFHGHLYDPLSGLMHFGAREYLPEIGQFARPEPLVVDVTRPVTAVAYAYAGGDPVNFRDRDGRCSEYPEFVVPRAFESSVGAMVSVAGAGACLGGRLDYRSLGDLRTFYVLEALPRALSPLPPMEHVVANAAVNAVPNAVLMLLDVSSPQAVVMAAERRRMLRVFAYPEDRAAEGEALEAVWEAFLIGPALAGAGETGVTGAARVWAAAGRSVATPVAVATRGAASGGGGAASVFYRVGEMLPDGRIAGVGPGAALANGPEFGALSAYEVGTFDVMRGRSVVGDGLDLHHVGQAHVMEQLVRGYERTTGAVIALPRREHVQIVNLRGVSGLSARQLLARDIRNLRKATGAPNRALRELIDLNKEMYPEAFGRPR